MELLIVIGIIAVLLAILLPVLSKSRERARQVVCLANVRQVNIAFLMYAQANRGFFPAPSLGNWPHDEDWIHWQKGRA